MSVDPAAPSGGRDELAALREELAAVRRREAELRRLLARAHEQLVQRDDHLIQELVHRSQFAERRVEEMRSTRVWRSATVMWGVRDRAKARLAAVRRRST